MGLGFEVLLSCGGDPCASLEQGDYNLGLHIGAVFIILACSFVGVFLPLMIKLNPFWEVPHYINKALYYGKFLGSGVILATGFIHIFPDACQELQQPCLPPFFSEDYLASPGLFAMLGAMLMHLGDTISSIAIANYHEDKNNLDIEGKDEGRADSCEHTHLIINEEVHFSVALLLELGISVHSVLIGISLGTARDEFVALLIAISFHQFFEGIGLGHVLIDSGKTLAIIASALFYTITTPVGVAIGIGIASVGETTAGIIAQGVLDSLAAGILIYSSLVSLLGIIFQSKTFKRHTPLEKSICFAFFYLGAAVMAVLAIWA